MKPNPPISGHKLLMEGRVLPGWDYMGYDRTLRVGEDRGGCECGARPSNFPNISVNDMKRWHRAHKADLRGEVMMP